MSTFVMSPTAVSHVHAPSFFPFFSFPFYAQAQQEDSYKICYSRPVTSLSRSGVARTHHCRVTPTQGDAGVVGELRREHQRGNPQGPPGVQRGAFTSAFQMFNFFQPIIILLHLLSCLVLTGLSVKDPFGARAPICKKARCTLQDDESSDLMFRHGDGVT